MRKLPFYFLFIVVSNSFSQVPFFQSYSLLKRNGQIKVNTIVQDKTGLIWFGTNKGLFRFNGVSYRNFTAAEGLPDENVTAIAEDSTGRIWAGHKTGAISILEHDLVTLFQPKEGLPKNEISDILFDHQGRLWFSALDEGLYYFINDRLHLLDDVDGLPDKFIYDLELDNVGRVWAGTDRGLVICSVKNEQADIEVRNNQSGLPDNIIKKIIRSNGEMWLASEDMGIFSVNEQATVFKKKMPDWNYGVVNDFVIQGNEAIVVIEQKGLLFFNLDNGKTRFYNASGDKGFEKTSCLMADREGNIWLGGAEVVLRLPAFSLEHAERNESFLEKNIIALCIDDKETLWYSMNGKLFYDQVDKSSGKILTTPFLTEKKWENSYVSSLYPDSKGYVWAGFLGQGLVRINPSSKEIFFLEALKNTTVLSMSGQDNFVWVASLSGAIQINTASTKPSVKYFTKTTGLSTDYIYQVFVDSKKRVWFATDGKGVDMLDASGFHHYQDGLKSKVVYGFAEDGLKRIWANIQGEGLYELADSRFIPFSSKGIQLRGNEVTCLSTDKNGNLVVIHESGIDVYDVKSNRVFRLGEEIGLRDFAPNLNAVTSDFQGGLYFGTSRGVIGYSPRSGRQSDSPTPRIENLKVVDQIVFPSGKEIFSYNQNEVTINYNGIWYQNTESLHYQYQLEKFDKNWIESKDHAATYSDLPPGDYTFRLKVSDSDFFSTHEAKVNFVIKPPFWRTTVFYILSVLTLVVTGFLVIKFRERKLIAEKHFLEARIQERTFEIQKKNEEIQAQAEEIIGINENLEMLVRARTAELEQKNRALEEYAFITAHELRAPLASILGLVNILTKVKLEEQDKIILDHLRESSERLESIVRTITEAIERGDQPHSGEKNS
jgi:ligand-binding sensor domain-containing protein